MATTRFGGVRVWLRSICPILSQRSEVMRSASVTAMSGEVTDIGFAVSTDGQCSTVVGAENLDTDEIERFRCEAGDKSFLITRSDEDPSRSKDMVVEATGVEPVSENPFTKLSPGSAGRLISAARLHPAKDERRSPFIRDCYKDELSVHVHRCVTPEPGPRYSREGRPPN